MPLRGNPRLVVPADATEPGRVQEIVRWGERRLSSGAREIEIDLGALEHFNSSLAAGLVLLSRRARTSGAVIHVMNAPETFISLLRIYRLEHALHTAGMVIDAHVAS